MCFLPKLFALVERSTTIYTTMSTSALVVSTGFVGAWAMAACLARRYIRRLVKPGLVQDLFFEAVAAAELCACCFELIISMFLVQIELCGARRDTLLVTTR